MKKAKITLWTGVRNIASSFADKSLRTIFSVVILIALGFTFFTQFFSVLLIQQFNYSEKVIYEKKNIGWKGDIPAYSYSTKKINKLGYKFRLSSIMALKKTIKAISKKTLF